MEIIFMLIILGVLVYFITPLIKKEKENYDYLIKRNKLIILYLEKRLNIDSDFNDLD